ncbi:MAG: carbohydrate kinase family protein [Marinisporobacter sp.]|jgi:sugar/nucleoside kinase (ribokinase family)|nr:carbohydrate kinase family protein [Marinisporobacter sp.]
MCDKKEPYVLVFGASVVDIFGFSKSKYMPYNSTPGVVKMAFGGVSRNIAENMARVGVSTKFISILGNDQKGQRMLDHSKVIGYDMSDSLILEKGTTPTYMAILDEKGEMVSAIADMESISEMNTDFIDAKGYIIRNAAYTFLDADDPENLGYILKKFEGKTKFVLDPISAAKAKNIRHLIKYFHTIKPNRHEAEVLAGFPIKNDEDLKKAGEYFLNLGIKNICISLDEEGVYYANGQSRGKIKVNHVAVKNVTGAGDAFVAGLGYGYMNNLSLEETIKFAMAMSIVTISHEAANHPDLNEKMIQEKVKNTNWIEVEY